jgi:hypothetical protein
VWWGACARACVCLSASVLWGKSVTDLWLASRLYPGYGPGVPDGYGTCYSFVDDGIRVGISCMSAAVPGADPPNAVRFRTALEAALLDLRALCLANAATTTARL